MGSEMCIRDRFNVEEFDPDPYMEALNKWGLPWKVCEDPELVKVWKANED